MDSLVVNHVICRTAAHLLDDILSEECCGLLVLDPPANYGITSSRIEDYDEDAHDFDLQTQAFVLLAERAKRVLAKGGSIVFMGEPRTVTTWDIAARRVGLQHTADLAVMWAKPKRGRIDLVRQRRLNTKHRDATLPSMFTQVKWHVRPGSRHAFNPKRAVTANSNVIVCRPVPVDDRVTPTQKPVEMFNYFISLLSNLEDLVVDPFCGSGAALVAATMNDREWVGGDHNPRLCAIARKRAHDKQLKHEDRRMQPVQLWVRGRLIDL